LVGPGEPLEAIGRLVEAGAEVRSALSAESFLIFCLLILYDLV
jgi:hypothetical protein